MEKIVFLGRASLCNQFYIRKLSVINIEKNSKLILGKNVSIGNGLRCVVGEKATLKIGDNVFINENVRIQCRTGIEIGPDSFIAWDVNIIDTDEHSIIFEDNSKSEIYKPTILGKHIWVGANSIILKGVEIGENCVVGANSVVTKSFPCNSLIAGNPAKLIKKINGWQK